MGYVPLRHQQIHKSKLNTKLLLWVTWVHQLMTTIPQGSAPSCSPSPGPVRSLPSPWPLHLPIICALLIHKLSKTCSHRLPLLARLSVSLSIIYILSFPIYIFVYFYVLLSPFLSPTHTHRHERIHKSLNVYTHMQTANSKSLTDQGEILQQCSQRKTSRCQAIQWICLS